MTFNATDQCISTKGVVQTDEDEQELQGRLIKDIFKNADTMAHWHATISSARGESFRKKLLSLLGDGLTSEEINRLRKEFGVEEYTRHINKFIELGLIKAQKINDKDGFMRTELGERAINLIRNLERKIGLEKAQKIFNTSMGKNSIRLFLRIYGQDRQQDFSSGEIIYTPLEIGSMSSFLPRSIEGIAAIDKLDDAGLVSYMDDGRVHVNPRRSVAFYQYLRGLYLLILTREKD